MVYGCEDSHIYYDFVLDWLIYYNIVFSLAINWCPSRNRQIWTRSRRAKNLTDSVAVPALQAYG